MIQNVIKNKKQIVPFQSHLFIHLFLKIGLRIHWILLKLI